MREQFIDHNFKDQSLFRIEDANLIIEEYQADGMTLTVRQLYYQFVARGLIENSQREYNKLTALISKARVAGLIDWSAIEDRTRNLASLAHWDNPGELVEAAARQYRRDLWENQEWRLEVWIEKEALAGVIDTICQELDVPYLACRGYVSQSELYDAGKRFAGYVQQGQYVAVIHLGDHDPSGIDMTRDNRDRLRLFSGEHIEIERVALNYDQVEEYQPPPNPAKQTDSRFVGYVDLYGDKSWELDALDPRVIRSLISTVVQKYRDDRLWDMAVEEQEDERQKLDDIASQI